MIESRLNEENWNTQLSIEIMNFRSYAGGKPEMNAPNPVRGNWKVPRRKHENQIMSTCSHKPVTLSNWNAVVEPQMSNNHNIILVLIETFLQRVGLSCFTFTLYLFRELKKLWNFLEYDHKYGIELSVTKIVCNLGLNVLNSYCFDLLF